MGINCSINKKNRVTPSPTENDPENFNKSLSKVTGKDTDTDSSDIKEGLKQIKYGVRISTNK